ncbi:D-tyrosyl-tRNA(Tyr) deacylase [Blomia tropicalis]|nr:D-tyrosyl-tRNA(Tyr) deacylase [Blomia tropicalis]
MKALIQRVKSASVIVDGNVISQIGQGLCVLIGISRDDTEKDSEWICNKILKLCLFDNPENGKRWSANVQTNQLEILCVSQFTLYTTLKGNKPDFHHAMEQSKSSEFYKRFLDRMRQQYQDDKIQDGQFGAMMEVNIVNDGPVTIQIESPQTALVREKISRT